MALYVRILFVRRIVQMWYTRIGNAEGELVAIACGTSLTCTGDTRESTCEAAQAAARKDRRSQTEDQLLLHAQLDRAL